MTEIKLKRAYDNISDDDGRRILVDKVWPRGIKKEELKLDDWAKEIAPTTDLRKEFGHDPEKFDWFTEQYKKELDENQKTPDFIEKVREYLKKDDVSFIYGAKDTEHNQAVVLKEYVNQKK